MASGANVEACNSVTEGRVAAAGLVAVDKAIQRAFRVARAALLVLREARVQGSVVKAALEVQAAAGEPAAGVE